MAYPSEPRLGQANQPCPHCCTEDATFIESDIFELAPGASSAAPDYVLLEQQRIGEPKALFAMQRCQVCGGVLIYCGDEMVYPRRDVSGGRYATWPDHLRAPMLLALQSYPMDTAYAALKLRGVLVLLCIESGMSQESPETTYVDYLLKRLNGPQDAYLHGWLGTTCERDGVCIQPNILHATDDMQCAGLLIMLINVVAQQLCGLRCDE